MRRIIPYITFYIFLCAFFVYGQDKKIKTIRQWYQECKDYTSVHEINLGRMVQGPGEHTTKIAFFYIDCELVDCYELGIDAPKPYTDILVKIELTTGIYNRQHYVEYLFDKNESLLFYYLKADAAYDTSGEKRYYFHNNELIKIITNPLVDAEYYHDKETGDYYSNDNGNQKYLTFPDYEKTKNFNSAEIHDGQAVIKKANEYKEVFKQLVEVEFLD